MNNEPVQRPLNADKVRHSPDPAHGNKTKNPLLYAWWVALAVGLICLIVISFSGQSATSAAHEEEGDVTNLSARNEIIAFDTPLTTVATETGELLPTPTSTQPIPTVTPTATPTINPDYITHIVETGEMPLSIANRYDIDVEQVINLNRIKNPSLLQVGQRLIIPVTATTIPPSPTITTTPDKPATPTATPRTHIIQAGDTPLSIALQHETTAEAIMLANGILNPSGLRVGEELIIPEADDFLELIGDVPMRLHVIQSGDTFVAIAARYGSTVEDILQVNPDINPSSLTIGTQVIVPITQPNQASADSTFNNTAQSSSTIIPALAEPGIVGLQQQMLAAVNNYRQDYGVSPYILDDTLSQIAFSRAADMDERGYFGHVTPEGKRAKNMVEERGMAVKWVGENIHRNTENEQNTVENSITWFMGHAAHRQNILHSRYDYIGIGVTKNAGFYTFVLIFAGN